MEYQYHEDGTSPTDSDSIFVFGSNLAGAARAGKTQDFLQARMYGRRCDASRRANELNRYAKREAYTLVQIEARFKVDGDVKPGKRKS